MLKDAVHHIYPVYIPIYITETPWCYLSHRLWSISSSLLTVPCTQTNCGNRSFAAYGPHVWNSLPDELRSTDITLTTFRYIPKTLLFNCSLAHSWHPAINELNNNYSFFIIINNNNNNNNGWRDALTWWSWHECVTSDPLTNVCDCPSVTVRLTVEPAQCSSLHTHDEKQRSYATDLLNTDQHTDTSSI